MSGKSYDSSIDITNFLQLLARQSSLPNVFKGIALFTPGGDLVYGVDPSKQAQWHVHLCHQLRETFNLAESPHFVVPGYTATVERWLDPETQQLKTIAEVYPAVRRYIPLLKALFELDNTDWHIAPWREEHCNRAVIETYRPRFPQLWTNHNSIVRCDPQHQTRSQSKNYFDSDSQRAIEYVIQLFISSKNSNAEQTLSNIHQLLEERLTDSYTLKVVDVAKHPEQANIHHITATPTLIKVSPKPTRRIVGPLDDIQRIFDIIASR